MRQMLPGSLLSKAAVQVAAGVQRRALCHSVPSDQHPCCEEKQRLGDKGGDSAIVHSCDQAMVRRWHPNYPPTDGEV